jgi:hypothetical protein
VLSVVMMAVMLVLSIGVAQAFAGIGAKHAETHMTDMPCPCPDKGKCPDKSCDDVSMCIVGCLSVFSISLFSASPHFQSGTSYEIVPVQFVGGVSRPPPLPPPTA